MIIAAQGNQLASWDEDAKHGLFFHGCMAHASGPNISPWPRVNVYSSLNRVYNGIRNHGLSEFYANHTIEELVPLSDDCLQRFAREGSQNGEPIQ